MQFTIYLFHFVFQQFNANTLVIDLTQKYFVAALLLLHSERERESPDVSTKKK